MKLTIALALILTGSQSVAEGAKCFRAKDTSKLQVSIYNESTERTTTDGVSAATLKIEVQQDDPDLAPMELATLRFKTKKGQVGEAQAYKTIGMRKFQVECDGGSMSLVSRGNDILADGGIRADIEGCDGEAYIRTEGTKFKAISCDRMPRIR